MARTRTGRGHGSLDPHRQFLLDELTNALQVAVLLIQDAERAASGATNEIAAARRQLERAISALKAFRERSD